MIKGLLSKIVDLVINILAFVAILSIIVLAVNKFFLLVADPTFIKVMTLISSYAGTALLILVALKNALKLPLFLTIPYIILIAIVVVIIFFEPVYQAVISTILGS